MRFHFVMLLIVIFVSLGMHGMASAATVAADAAQAFTAAAGDALPSAWAGS